MKNNSKILIAFIAFALTVSPSFALFNKTNKVKPENENVKKSITSPVPYIIAIIIILAILCYGYIRYNKNDD